MTSALPASSGTAGAASAAPRNSRFVAVAICCAVIIVDGYDLIVYGTVVPTLVGGTAEWTLTKAQAGAIGSYALIGMLIGALIVGTVTDLLGRRRIMLICIAWFSVAMLFASYASTPELFGLTRFIAGIGLGGVVPTAIALTIEYAHPKHRSTTNAVMFSGYSVGGILAALLAIWVIPELGWRAMFVIGAVVGALLLPVAWFKLPESAAYLLGRGRTDEARELADRYGIELEEPVGPGAKKSALSGLQAIFHPKLVGGTLLFWLGTAVGLLLVYGLNTWLAQIMRSAGYPMGPALAFLLVLNLGAIIGTPLLGTVADRIGSKKTTSTMFLVAALCLFLLSFKLPAVLLFTLVAIAGACTIGTTILVNAYTANYYPAHLRAAGLGWALGIGRLGAIVGPMYGAFILDSGWGQAANFYAFAVPAVIGAVAMLAVPERSSRPV